MSDREQAIKELADYLHIGAPAVELGLSDHSRDTDFWACQNLLADDVAQRERVIALERALREVEEILNPDKEDGYRADDPEGAMDTAHSKARAALNGDSK